MKQSFPFPLSSYHHKCKESLAPSDSSRDLCHCHVRFSPRYYANKHGSLMNGERERESINESQNGKHVPNWYCQNCRSTKNRIFLPHYECSKMFPLSSSKEFNNFKKKSAVFRNAILIQVIISFKLSDETQVIKDAIKNINTNMNILRKKQFIPCALDWTVNACAFLSCRWITYTTTDV